MTYEDAVALALQLKLREQDEGREPRVFTVVRVHRVITDGPLYVSNEFVVVASAPPWPMMLDVYTPEKEGAVL